MHAWRGSAPPWWPAGEPWPPHGRGFGRHRRVRSRFFRRVVVIGTATLLLAVWGVISLAAAVGTRLGLAAWVAPTLVAVTAATLGVTAFFGTMRRFAAPLNAVMDAADRVADGDYGVRVQESGAPPVRALARSFNTMTERLQNADRQRRDLMADVAHELRTPLSVLQGRLEGLIDGVYPRDEAQLAGLLDETRVLSRLIDDLRTLALSDAGVLQLQREPVELAAVIRDVIQSLGAEARGTSVSLTLAEPASTDILNVDPVRMREVLTNLISNSLQHTPPGGAVTVSLRQEGGQATITVTDTGAGMPEQDVARMFDRFYKGPGSRGSGLGLTIAKNLVTAHGGEISASSRVNEGTTVTVTLPRDLDP